MAGQPTNANLAALQQATKVLQERLVKDEGRVPDVFDTIQSASSSSYNLPPNDAWTPFYKRRTIMIPEGLFSQYEPAKSQCGMGLLPEIDRAWIALNNRLYLWDYVDGTHFDRFDEQPHVITSVSVVNPRPGIFIENIRHLLILSTPVSLLVLGLSTVAAPPNPTGPTPTSSHTSLQIYATDYNIITENIEMASIVSTSSGRVFMCGIQDGCLYEMVYQAKEGWFTKKCYLVNHSAGAGGSLLPSVFGSKSSDAITSLALDDSRGYLYALTSRPSIILYQIPPASTSSPTALTRVATVSDLLRQAQAFSPAEPSLDPRSFGISSIHPIRATESRGVHLVVVTVTGVRFYFSTHKRGYGGYRITTNPNDPPQTLELVHVRTPPSSLAPPNAPPTGGNAFQQGGSTKGNWNPTSLGPSEYSSGLLVAAQSHPGETDPDTLLCVAPDIPSIAQLNKATPSTNPNAGMAMSQTYGQGYGSSVAPYGSNKPLLTELPTLLSIPGRTWAISPLSAASKPTPSATSGWNELLTQSTAPPLQFLILTNEGISVVVKKRAVDCLKELIEREGSRRGVGGEGGELVKGFLERYGRDETCAMTLSIASSNSFLQTSTSSSHLTLSTSRLGNGAEDITVGAVSESVASDAKRAFYDIGGSPTVADSGIAEGSGGVGSGRVIFSGRYEGFVLYLSRLVRPIWKAKVTTGKPNAQTSNVAPNVLSSVQGDLEGLKAFLDRNPQLFDSVGDYSLRRGNPDQDAWREEQAAVTRLQAVMIQTIEAISFVLLLVDYKLPDIVASCDPALQNALLSLTYETLLTTQTGRDVAKGLVNNVINRQTGQPSGVDAISETLQRRCGSFCSSDDVMLYKAIENIRRAKETKDMAERRDSLRESLRLLLKSTKNLPFDTLKEVCADYRELRYPNGAIELPLKCAEDADADGQGREYWNAGLPQGDSRGAAYQRRTKCYDCALESLTTFDKLLEQSADSMLIDDLEALQANSYRLALDSGDPVWHSYLYDWFVSTGRTDQFLEIRSPFIEHHLSREPRTRQKCELLWQFYVRNGLFLRAAKVLAQLAESREFDLTLEDRIAALALAVGNAKSHPASEFGRQEAAGEFIIDLEEKLEVAHTQLEILQAILSRFELGPEEQRKVQVLNGQLMNITQLYQNWADPYDLFDMKLLILKVSEHHDKYMAASIWESIISQADQDARQSSDRPEIAVADTLRKLGRKFHPSEIAFPLDTLSKMLDQYAWGHREDIPRGWAPRTFIEAGVSHGPVWEQWEMLRTSDIPPYHEPSRQQFLLSNIAILLSDWLNEVLRPGSTIERRSFPADQLNDSITSYLGELSRWPNQDPDTRTLLSEAQNRIRTRF